MKLQIFKCLAPALATICIGCSDNRSTIYPWGWEKLDRQTDLLMPVMQEAFLGDTSLDSCRTLVRQFHEYADGDDAPDIEKARAVFWDARLAFASDEPEEAYRLFRQSLEMTDSLRYPFDAKYINLCLEPFEGRTLEAGAPDRQRYMSMCDDLDYALSHDARVFGAIRAQYLSCFMTYSGNPTRALYYALLADSLYSDAGRDGDRLNNRMNVAVNRILAGDTLTALEDYKWIDGQIRLGVPHSPVLEPLVNYNRWIEVRDTASLLRLRAGVKDVAELQGYNALASAYLAEIGINSGDTDSLRLRISDMENGLGMISDPSQLAVVIKNLGRAYSAFGDHDKAFHYLNQYPELAEEVEKLLTNDSFSVAETERIINGIERERIELEMRRKVRQWVFGCLLALIIAALCFYAYKIISRLRRAKISSDMALEQSRRAELSMTLSVQEKERQLEQLSRNISSMIDAELIDADAARRIEAGIRSDRAAAKANEEFGRVFSTLSPQFRSRLQEMCPQIGRNMLRMAEYIAIGMDNSHIAAVMNIKPESVRQNRWRLRSQLGLESDDSLDRTLRELL